MRKSNGSGEAKLKLNKKLNDPFSNSSERPSGFHENGNGKESARRIQKNRRVKAKEYFPLLLTLPRVQVRARARTSERALWKNDGIADEIRK